MGQSKLSTWLAQFFRKRDMRKLIYLASPFTDPDPKVMLERAREVCKIAGRIIFKQEVNVFCPIAHTYSICISNDRPLMLPGGFEYWEDFDLRMLRTCDEMWIATMPGWTQSKGIRAEHDDAWKRRQPVFLLSPYNLQLMSLERPMIL